MEVLIKLLSFHSVLFLWYSLEGKMHILIRLLLRLKKMNEQKCEFKYGVFLTLYFSQRGVQSV